MDIHFKPLHIQLNHTQSNDYLMLQMTAPSSFNDIACAPPKRVCFVIDTSGSMADAIGTVTSALIKGVEKLRDQDSVCVVTYNSEVQLLCEWNNVTDGFKQVLTGKIRGLKVGGSTNISGALLKSMEQSMKAGDETVAIVFLTDGKANRGVTDINSLGPMIGKMVPPRTSIFTLGFGNEHDPMFMGKISEVARGSYYYIEHEDSVEDAFLGIIGKTMDICFQNLSLKVQADKMHFLNCATEQEFTTLHLGDMHLGEKKTWLFNAKYLEGLPNYQWTYEISGINVITTEAVCETGDASIDRGEDTSVDTLVQKRIRLTNASKQLKRATVEASKQNFNGAFNIIRETSMSMKGLPELQENLNDIANHLLDSNQMFRMSSLEQSMRDDSLLGLSPIAISRNKTLHPNILQPNEIDGIKTWSITPSNSTPDETRRLFPPTRNDTVRLGTSSTAE